MDLNLTKVVRRIEMIPTLPEMYQKMTAIIHQPNTTAADLASVLEKDPALTGRLIRLVNSALYALPRKVGTIRQAIVIVGFRSIQQLVLSTSVVKMFKGGGDDLFSPYTFWKHSIATALATQPLAREIRLHDPEEAFTAGLLHDIGHLLLAEYQTEVFRQILETCAETGQSALEVERSILGYNHGSVGGALMDYWKFPLHLVDAVQYHHTPSRAPEDREPICRVVHLADRIAMAAGYPSDLDKFGSEGEVTTEEAFGLSPTQLSKIQDVVAQSLPEVVETYGL